VGSAIDAFSASSLGAGSNCLFGADFDLGPLLTFNLEPQCHIAAADCEDIRLTEIFARIRVRDPARWTEGHVWKQGQDVLKPAHAAVEIGRKALQFVKPKFARKKHLCRRGGPGQEREIQLFRRMGKHGRQGGTDEEFGSGVARLSELLWSGEGPGPHDRLARAAAHGRDDLEGIGRAQSYLDDTDAAALERLQKGFGVVNAFNGDDGDHP
jgi:hypothetical protein